MNIMDIAIDQEKATKGVRCYYDKDLTCGAVIAQYMSAAHRASIAKHRARFQKEFEIYEKEDNKTEVEKLSRIVMANSMAETVVLEIFGFHYSDPNDNESAVDIESNEENIFKLLSMPEFEGFYAWCISKSNDSDTFSITDDGTWVEIGKKLQGT